MPERRRANRMAVRLFFSMIIAVAALILGVAYVGYQGRVDLVASQRRGCERGKLDRIASAKGWRTAEARAISQGQPEFAVIYKGLAEGFEKRSRVPCSVAFPDATFWP